MNRSSNARTTPLIILALVAALVAMSWLYVGERSRHYVTDDNARTAALGGERVYQWKLVTTWPKNFPGLGTAPEKFANAAHFLSSKIRTPPRKRCLGNSVIILIIIIIIIIINIIIIIIIALKKHKSRKSKNVSNVSSVSSKD